MTRPGQPRWLVAESDRILPAMYGMNVGGSLGEFVPKVGPLISAAGAATGHIVGPQVFGGHNVLQREQIGNADRRSGLHSGGMV